MSFTFGFSGDDIEDGQENEKGNENSDTLPDELSKWRISDSKQNLTHTIPPQRHSLDELVGDPSSTVVFG